MSWSDTTRRAPSVAISVASREPTRPRPCTTTSDSLGALPSAAIAAWNAAWAPAERPAALGPVQHDQQPEPDLGAEHEIDAPRIARLRERLACGERGAELREALVGGRPGLIGTCAEPLPLVALALEPDALDGA